MGRCEVGLCKLWLKNPWLPLSQFSCGRHIRVQWLPLQSIHMVGWKKRSALKPFSQDVWCKSQCSVCAGDLWVGSESGLINVWPCEATFGGLVYGQEDEIIAALFFAILCMPLRGLIIRYNHSQTELCFQLTACGLEGISTLLWYVPFCCMLNYKDHFRMMLQHGLCFGSFCCVSFASLSLPTWYLSFCSGMWSDMGFYFCHLSCSLKSQTREAMRVFGASLHSGPIVPNLGLPQGTEIPTDKRASRREWLWRGIENQRALISAWLLTTRPPKTTTQKSTFSIIRLNILLLHASEANHASF